MSLEDELVQVRWWMNLKSLFIWVCWGEKLLCSLLVRQEHHCHLLSTGGRQFNKNVPCISILPQIYTRDSSSFFFFFLNNLARLLSIYSSIIFSKIRLTLNQTDGISVVCTFISLMLVTGWILSLFGWICLIKMCCECWGWLKERSSCGVWWCGHRGRQNQHKMTVPCSSIQIPQI